MSSNVDLCSTDHSLRPFQSVSWHRFQVGSRVQEKALDSMKPRHDRWALSRLTIMIVHVSMALLWS
ncbi:hypothetical protein AUEXF2481DRAFT_41262 [Aureobasidium subglaciale EXF-2481]|uniref:Uncharacterized protein n=1 Tax=Aureobasidium subglaciale (strain EXF-2481) TaxID=1043005 RepID=A0A074YJ12_AURSE|nr:uncharacterized protein AUEXF2481DRAFT_41262 [Aureobasidium subglaciale EXF-2481]KEQ94067.1 hypothetical protein AUEXF2481DRAFT_41262 [Aureobasidium subglaciale EXF-2481]